MKPMLVLLLAGASPALAQHGGHTSPAAPAATSSCTPEHAAMGHCTLPPPAQQGTRVPDPHAGHTMPAQQQQQQPTAPPVDPHAGHQMPSAPATPADPHARHDTGAVPPSSPAPPKAPPPPEAFTGPVHAADLYYGTPAMADARNEMLEEHGGIEAYRVLVDRLERRIRDGRDGYGWDAQAWYGGDINKLWLKSEGEGALGERVDDAEVQALWSRAIDPWFDLQVGVRYDFRPDPERAYLVAGVQGLAPYWFEVDGTLFLSNKGDLSARFEGEYDLRITQSLILQPNIEFQLAAQDVPELGIGSGLSTAEFGTRLRYELRPEWPAVIAPYVGVQYERAFGDTRRFRRAEGDDAGGWNLLVGVRTWF